MAKKNIDDLYNKMQDAYVPFTQRLRAKGYGANLDRGEKLLQQAEETKMGKYMQPDKASWGKRGMTAKEHMDAYKYWQGDYPIPRGNGKGNSGDDGGETKKSSSKGKGGSGESNALRNANGSRPYDNGPDEYGSSYYLGRAKSMPYDDGPQEQGVVITDGYPDLTDATGVALPLAFAHAWKNNAYNTPKGVFSSIPKQLGGSATKLLGVGTPQVTGEALKQLGAGTPQVAASQAARVLPGYVSGNVPAVTSVLPTVTDGVATSVPENIARWTGGRALPGGGSNFPTVANGARSVANIPVNSMGGAMKNVYGTATGGIPVLTGAASVAPGSYGLGTLAGLGLATIPASAVARGYMAYNDPEYLRAIQEEMIANGMD